MGRKRKNNKIAKVHEDLGSLDLRINEFGELVSNIDMDKVNAFLTKNVPDKKLMNRNDDAYQQEFKEMGMGGEDDEDANYPVEDSSSENDEDDIKGILGSAEDPADEPKTEE